MNSNRKVILFWGGAFNPPTLAHLSFPEYILHEYSEVEKVLFVPVNSLYEKNCLIDNEHRFNMLKLATRL